MPHRTEALIVAKNANERDQTASAARPDSINGRSKVGRHAALFVLSDSWSAGE